MFGKNQYPEKLIPRFIKQLNENKKKLLFKEMDLQGHFYILMTLQLHLK